MTDRLTQREQQVLALIADNLSNKAIAKRLGISVNTVKTHVRRIMQKLDLTTRLQVAVHVYGRERE